MAYDFWAGRAYGSYLRRVMDMRRAPTGGTQCCATSAPLPFSTRQEPAMQHSIGVTVEGQSLTVPDVQLILRSAVWGKRRLLLASNAKRTSLSMRGV